MEIFFQFKISTVMDALICQESGTLLIVKTVQYSRQGAQKTEHVLTINCLDEFLFMLLQQQNRLIS